MLIPLFSTLFYITYVIIVVLLDFPKLLPYPTLLPGLVSILVCLLLCNWHRLSERTLLRFLKLVPIGCDQIIMIYPCCNLLISS